MIGAASRVETWGRGDKLILDDYSKEIPILSASPADVCDCETRERRAPSKDVTVRYTEIYVWSAR